jgi:hypothetical protein
MKRVNDEFQWGRIGQNLRNLLLMMPFVLLLLRLFLFVFLCNSLGYLAKGLCLFVFTTAKFKCNRKCNCSKVLYNKNEGLNIIFCFSGMFVFF